MRRRRRTKSPLGELEKREERSPVSAAARRRDAALGLAVEDAPVARAARRRAAFVLATVAHVVLAGDADGTACQAHVDVGDAKHRGSSAVESQVHGITNSEYAVAPPSPMRRSPETRLKVGYSER
jgi:hypothetical protein